MKITTTSTSTLEPADLKAIAAVVVAEVKPLIPTAAQVAAAVWAQQQTGTDPADGQVINGSSAYWLKKGLMYAKAAVITGDRGTTSAELGTIVEAAVRRVLGK